MARYMLCRKILVYPTFLLLASIYFLGHIYIQPCSCLPVAETDGFSCRHLDAAHLGQAVGVGFMAAPSVITYLLGYRSDEPQLGGLHRG